MKNLKNLVFNDFEESEVLNDLYEDEETQPYNLSMRVNCRTTKPLTAGWNDLHKSYTKQRQFWAHAGGFMENSIGKDYDQVYSDFCHKFPEWIGHVNTRDYFKDCFERKYWRYHGVYYVDDNNKIQKTPDWKKPRRKVTYTYPNDKAEYRHYIKKDVLTYRRDWKNHIIQWLGHEVAEMLEEKEYLTHKEYWKLMNLPKIYKVNLNDPENPIMERTWTIHGFRPTQKDIPLRDAFKECEVVHSNSVTYWEGDPRYTRYVAEKKDAEKKDAREKKRNMEEIRNNIIKTEFDRAKENKKRKKMEKRKLENLCLKG